MASQDPISVETVDATAEELSALVIHPHEESVTKWAKVSKTPASGFGVFAIQDIPRGTLIAVETAVLSIPNVPDEEAAIEFCAALHKSTKPNLDRLESLSLDPLAWKSVSGDAVRSRIWQWCQDNLGTGVDGQRMSHHELSVAVDYTCRCYGIFLTNNLETGSDSGRGVYAFFSRMNHSCRPDIFEYFNTKTGELSIRAIHDIKAGDQIHSTYVDLLQPRKKRQKTLEAWGFMCQCPACANPAFDALSDRAVELDDMLEEYMYYHEDFSSDTDDDHEPFLKGPDEALGVAQELIQIIRDQGIYGESLFHTYVVTGSTIPVSGVGPNMHGRVSLLTPEADTGTPLSLVSRWMICSSPSITPGKRARLRFAASGPTAKCPTRTRSNGSAIWKAKSHTPTRNGCSLPNWPIKSLRSLEVSKSRGCNR